MEEEETDIFLTNNYHTSYLTTIITNVTNFITEPKIKQILSIETEFMVCILR
jgi:hypothetical protein